MFRNKNRCVTRMNIRLQQDVTQVLLLRLLNLIVKHSKEMFIMQGPLNGIV